MRANIDNGLSTKYVLGWQRRIANSNNFLQTQDANGQMSKTIFLLNFWWKLLPKKTNTVTLLRKENTICRVTDNLIKGDGCCHTPAQLLAPKAFWSLKMATMLTRHTRRFQWNSDHSWIKKKIQIPKSRKYRCFGIQTGSWTS